jgi:hypothetical protein
VIQPLHSIRIVEGRKNMFSNRFRFQTTVILGALTATIVGCSSSPIQTTAPIALGGSGNVPQGVLLTAPVASPTPNTNNLPPGLVVARGSRASLQALPTKYGANASQLVWFSQRAAQVLQALHLSSAARSETETYGNYVASLPAIDRARRSDVDDRRVVYVVSDKLRVAKATEQGYEFLPGTLATSVYDAASDDILVMKLNGPIRKIQ